ncbi:hydroxyectoine utilization dehydratase EutB [Cardiobacteriales bacterium ML27]|uniref:Hydroxyectoine utilization dehydratase EutB n=2 Tax=Ostreibacterium oceani TaxID=2654998 RepID=A0A6N7EX72_9GAMM|nr:hydroxyectoine utilization dehydratase EutB [Ostreibacterium oceani]
MKSAKPLNLQSVYQAQHAIRDTALKTPLIRAESLSTNGYDVQLKLETLQPIGAFKLRGAANAIAQLSPAELARGVVCASTGNHGRALTYAAKKMGSQATICMSTLVPRNKVEAIRALGAQVEIFGNSQDDAQTVVDQLVAEKGLIEIPPFDHADIIAGQGTIGLELLADFAQIDSVIVGLSGGGLLGGIAMVLKTINPNIRVIGVSPKRGACMAACLAANRPVEITEEPTLADSLGGGIGLNNQYTFDLTKQYLDDLILLSEAQIARGMQHLFLHEGIVAEGGGAVGVAALIDQDIKQRLAPLLGKHIALIISGKNIDMAQFYDIVNPKTATPVTD